MAYKEKSDAIKYNNEFNKKAYDRINLTVPKGQKEVIQAAAAKNGESVNEYIKKAIVQRMEREQTKAGEGFGFSEPVQKDINNSRLTSSTPPVSTSGHIPSTDSDAQDENRLFLPIPIWEDSTPEVEEKLLSILRKRKIPIPTVQQYKAMSLEQQSQTMRYLIEEREKAHQVLDEYEARRPR